MCVMEMDPLPKGIEMQAVVNKDLSKRTRTCETVLTDQRVMERDYKIAVEIIKFQVGSSSVV